jgi:hypothetical protein
MASFLVNVPPLTWASSLAISFINNRTGFEYNAIVDYPGKRLTVESAESALHVVTEV